MHTYSSVHIYLKDCDDQRLLESYWIEILQLPLTVLIPNLAEKILSKIALYLNNKGFHRQSNLEIDKKDEN